MQPNPVSGRLDPCMAPDRMQPFTAKSGYGPVPFGTGPFRGNQFAQEIR